MDSHKKSRFIKWSLILGIVIVLNLFFSYAISLVYPAPDYPSYCPNEQVVSPPATKAECLKVGGQWNESSYAVDKLPQGNPASPIPAVTAPAKSVEVTGYCNPTYTCQNKYDMANKSYERNVFIALVILGIASLIVGLFLKITEAVTIALSFGGVLSLIIASIRYWSQAQNVLKVAILGIALVALIWVGIKKFNE